MQIIDKNVLDAVGETVIRYLDEQVKAASH